MTMPDSNTAACDQYHARQDVADTETELLKANMPEHISELWDDERARVMMLINVELEVCDCARLATLLALAEQLPHPFNKIALELRKSFNDDAEAYVYDNASEFLRR